MKRCVKQCVRIFSLLAQDISEVGIYKIKQESKKTRKHHFDQESDQEKRKKKRKHALDQESDEEKTITVKKKKRKKTRF